MNAASSALVKALSARTWRWRDEVDLHASIDDVLTEAGIAFAREVRLSARDRIDFVVGDVGLEVKVSATSDAVHRQLRRYASHERLTALVLFTSCAPHLRLPATVVAVDGQRSVPLEVVRPRWV